MLFGLAKRLALDNNSSTRNALSKTQTGEKEMSRKTKSTMQGWTKTAKNEYAHVNNHRVTKIAQGWMVSGPNRNDGFVYTTMREAMYAAAKTHQVWVS